MWLYVNWQKEGINIHRIQGYDKKERNESNLKIKKKDILL